MLRRRTTACLLALAMAIAAPVLVLRSVADRSQGLSLQPATLPELEQGAAADLVVPAAGREMVEPRPADALRSGCYTAPEGTVLRFAIESRQDTILEIGGEVPARANHRFDARGELTLALLDRRDDDILVALTLAPLDLRLETAGELDEEASAALATELARTAHLRLRTDGTCAGWSFPDGMSVEARLALCGLLAQARFVVPTNAGEAWSTEEHDSSGTYAVDYRRSSDDGRVCEIARRRRTLAPDGPGEEVRVQARIDDHGLAHFDRSVGWLVSAECSEHTVVELGPDARASADVTTVWRLLEQREDRAPSSAPWDLVWCDGVGSADLGDVVAEQQRRRDAAAIEGLTLENLLYDLERVLATDGLQSDELFRTRELLKSWLRQNSGELEHFAALLSDGSLSEDAVGVALSALGSVGSEGGQAFLAEVLGDPQRSEETRALSLLALFQVSSPTPETRAAAVRQWLDDTASGELRGAALMLLGAQARESAELRADLLTQEQRARADHLLGCYLAALGNARMFEHVEPFRSDDDPQVRAAAEQVLAYR